MSYNPQNPNGQAAMANSAPVVIASDQSAIPVSGTVAVTGAGDASAANQTALNTLTGAVTETAPGTDTASSGLNGRLQRIAQRLSSLITALGSPFQAGGSIGNTAFGVNNGAGGSAVNIQDGGNSITVDGPLTDTQLRATAVPVSLASVPSHPVTNAGTFAVQVSSALPAGTNNIGDVDVLSLPALPSGSNTIGNVNVVGTVPVSGPLTDTQLRATAVPVSGTLAVTGPLTDTQLRATPVPISGTIDAITVGYAPHAIGLTILNKSGEYNTTQTGVALWTPAAGKKFVITDITISTAGTTAGIVTVWQGAVGDTTYTIGTDPTLFRGEFSPSATVDPGMVKGFTVPFVSSTADHILRVTTSAAITMYIQVNGYEIT